MSHEDPPGIMPGSSAVSFSLMSYLDAKPWNDRRPLAIGEARWEHERQRLVWALAQLTLLVDMVQLGGGDAFVCQRLDEVSSTLGLALAHHGQDEERRQGPCHQERASMASVVWQEHEAIREITMRFGAAYQAWRKNSSDPCPVWLKAARQLTQLWSQHLQWATYPSCTIKHLGRGH